MCTHVHPCTPAAPHCSKLSTPRRRGPGDVGRGSHVPGRTGGHGAASPGERAGRDERCAASCGDSRSSSALLPYEQELKPHRKPQGFPKGLSECSLPPAPLPFPLRVSDPPRPSPDPPWRRRIRPWQPPVEAPAAPARPRTLRCFPTAPARCCQPNKSPLGAFWFLLFCFSPLPSESHDLLSRKHLRGLPERSHQHRPVRSCPQIP